MPRVTARKLPTGAGGAPGCEATPADLVSGTVVDDEQAAAATARAATRTSSFLTDDLF